MKIAQYLKVKKLLWLYEINNQFNYGKISLPWQGDLIANTATELHVAAIS